MSDEETVIIGVGPAALAAAIISDGAEVDVGEQRDSDLRVLRNLGAFIIADTPRHDQRFICPHENRPANWHPSNPTKRGW